MTKKNTLNLINIRPNDLTKKLTVFLAFYYCLIEIFYGMTKIIDGGQSQGPILSISNLSDQSDELRKSQRLF